MGVCVRVCVSLSTVGLRARVCDWVCVGVYVSMGPTADVLYPCADVQPTKGKKKGLREDDDLDFLSGELGSRKPKKSAPVKQKVCYCCEGYSVSQAVCAIFPRKLYVPLVLTCVRMRTKAWLAARVPLWLLACLALRVRRSPHLRVALAGIVCGCDGRIIAHVLYCAGLYP